jgi:hypothetical protein
MRALLLSCLVGIACLSVAGIAARKPAVIDPEAYRKDIERQINLDRFERALRILEVGQSNLDPAYVTNTFRRLYYRLGRMDDWRSLVDQMPDEPLRDGLLGQYWASQRWTAKARDYFQRFLERGGAPSNLDSSSLLLLTSTIQIPGHWIPLREFGDGRGPGGRGANYSLPWGSHFYVFFGEARDYGESDSEIAATLAYFRSRFGTTGRYALSDRNHTLKNGRFLGALRQESAPSMDKDTALIGIVGEESTLMRRRFVFCLMGNRGSEFKAYEVGRGKVLFEVMWFYGGKEEAATLEDVERFLESLTTR